MEDEYKLDELTVKAMKSKCAVCGLKLRPYQLWRMTETRRGTLIFVHYYCVMKKDKKEV